MMNDDLTYRKIFIFWLPLAATWMMMALEGPFVSAVIARLPNEINNLAAYGVALPLGWLIESPILMLLSASTTLVKDRNSFLKMQKFSFIMNAFVTAVILFICIPSVFDHFGQSIIGLSKEVSDLTHLALMMFIPWPALVGMRRFYQGVLIRGNETKKVAIGTVIRLTTMMLTGILLYQFSSLPGAAIGGAAHTVGAFFEFVSIWWVARHTVNRLKETDTGQASESLTYSHILRFYIPLAMTPFLSLSAPPVITFFLTDSRHSVESLAIMPVLISLNFIFNSLAISYVEAAIALTGDAYQNFRKTRNFAIGLALSTSGTMMLIAYTPLADVWFYNIVGLSPELVIFALPAIQIIFVTPALRCLNSYLTAMHLIARKTRPVTFSTAIELLSVFVLMFITTKYSLYAGVICAAITLSGSRLFSMLSLIPTYRILMKQH